MTGPLAEASCSPLRTWLPSEAVSRQPGLQQVAAAQAGGFALRRDADVDVEMVALLNARPQNALDHHQRHVAGRQEAVGVGDVAFLISSSRASRSARALGRFRCRAGR